VIEYAGDSSLPDVPVPDIPLSNVLLTYITLPEVHMDGAVGDEWTSPPVADEAMVVVFGLGFGSWLVRFLCSKQFISSIDYYLCRKVFESLKVYHIHGFCIGCILLVVLYSYYYRTLRMQHYSNSWHVRNLLVMVWLLNKLAESIVSLHTTLLRRGTNFDPCPQCLLHS